LRSLTQRAVDTRQEIPLEFFPGRGGAAAARVDDRIDRKALEHVTVDSIQLAQPPLTA